MTPQANASLWLWATESGEQHAGSEHELVMCLSSRALPPYTLVWRSGWSEWLPAMQVAELARGLPPGTPFVPREARPTSPGAPPPPPPIARYPELRRWAQEPDRASVVPLERMSGVPPEGEENAQGSSAAPHDDAGFDEPDEITPPVPTALLQRAARRMMETTPPRDLGLAAAAVRARQSVPPTVRAPVPTPPDALVDTPERISLADMALADVVAAGDAMRAPRLESFTARFEAARDTAPLARRARRWPWALLALAFVVGGGAFLTRARWWPAPPAREIEVAVLPARPVVPEPEPAPPPPPKTFGCRAAGAPHEVDDWAVPEVPIALAALPNQKRVALAYAQSRERAIGLTFDPATYGSERAFSQFRDDQIYSVTPLVASGELEFRVERMGDKLALSTAIDTTPPLRIGMNDSGVAGGPIGRRPQRIWALSRVGLTALPQVAPHALGFLVAARIGRRDPSLRVGVISAEGVAHTSLSRVDLPKGELGVPALATSADDIALAVVHRGSSGAGDTLMVAHGTMSELPLKARPLALGSGEPLVIEGLSLAPLGAEGFALSWIEGDAPGRPKLALLDTELSPRAQPLELALPPGAEPRAIHNGGLFRAGERLLAFYFLRRSQGYSLWVTGLECGAS